MKNEPGAAHRARRRYRGSPRRQHGVVLLALVLVVLVGSSYVLLNKLSRHAQDYARDVQTQVALRQAKQALIRYAVSYPELHEDSSRIPGPGYLPCPDHTDDGEGESDCSDDPDSPATTISTLGRLPTRELGLDALVDGSGESLWYAVSQSFKKNQDSGYVLNSETPGTLSVDTTDDIVAVIIAPGSPLPSQTARRGTSETATYATGDQVYLASVAGQYLEDENANVSNDDTAYVTGSTNLGSPAQCTDGSLDDDEIEAQCFNDSLITITRQELMAAVEKRVANDVRGALAGWRTASGGAFPWLTPYSDPRRGGRSGGGLAGYGVSGRHTDASPSSTVLKDSGAQLSALGVGINDRVWNVTDGSHGSVTAVTATTVTVGSLVGGSANEFAQSDMYFIETSAPALGVLFTGAAAASSSGKYLVSAVDFESYGVVPGDIVDEINVLTGAIVTRGLVTSVDGNELELDSTSSADFDPGDTYRIRSALGVASAGAGNSLTDDKTDFASLGVATGDLVYNLTDGAQGIVDTVSGQTLTVSSLYGGADNTFAANDNYALVRHLPETGTRYGLLPVHEMGKPFVTDFSVAWSLTAANLNTVSVAPAAGAATTYTTALTNWIEGSTAYSDAPDDDDSYPDAVPADADIACIWAGANVAHCSGSYTDAEFLKADVDSVSQAGAIYTLTDTGSRFNYAGVRAGAKVRNLSQPLLGDGVVHAARATSQNVINVVAIDDGGSPFAVAAGEEIRVWVASKSMPTAATGGLTADGATFGNQVCNTGANFWSFVGAGDTIRLNDSAAGNPVGLITGAPSADCVTYTDLQGGTATTISSGDSFRILYDFVEQRQWQARVRMAGSAVLGNSAPGIRARTVCQGFGSDCDYQYAGAVYVANDATPSPVVQFEDCDVAVDPCPLVSVLGTASVTVPSGGTAQGSLMVSGLNLQMMEDGDESTDAGNLPRWFLRNRWHEYAFVSYSDALSPGNATGLTSNCTTGVDCITVIMPDPAGATLQDRKAVVVMAGAQLSSQDRSTGSLFDYFEDENSDADAAEPFQYSIFAPGETGDASINDQVLVVIPCSAPNAHKVWPDCD